MANYPNYYNSEKQYKEAEERANKERLEIVTAVINNAPTEEIKNMLIKGAINDKANKQIKDSLIKQFGAV